MADKELQDIIRSVMPKARIIKSTPLGAADHPGAIKREAASGEVAAPDLEQLIDKYFGAPRDGRVTRGFGAGAVDSRLDDSIELTEVELPADPMDDTSKRLAKRTVLVDRKAKKVLGSSG